MILLARLSFLLAPLVIPARPFQQPPTLARKPPVLAPSASSTSTSAAANEAVDPSDLASGAGTGSSSSSSTSPPQIIDVVEPTTGTPVRIVGTMHYNPTSVAQVRRTISDLASRDLLGSVVVESCDVRWNTTMEILSTPRGKLLEPVLTSEMKAASDAAVGFGRPVVLGDQRIDVTGERLGEAVKQTAADLLSPFGGGWKRFYDDVAEAADMALPTGPGYLSPWSFFDPRLLIAAPVSFAKYPLSFLARNPLSTAAVFAVMFGLTALDGQSAASDFASASAEERLGSVAASLAFAALEVAVFGRILIRVLLAERNEVIAKNILDQCQIYSPSSQFGSIGAANDNGNGPGRAVSGFLSDLMSLFRPSSEARGKDGDSDGRAPYSYLPGSTLSAFLSDTDRDREGKYVVAVLGMAHANGVVKLLKEELV